MDATVEQTRSAVRLEVTDGSDCGPGDRPNRCSCGSRVMRHISDVSGAWKVMCLASHAGWPGR